MYICVNKRQVYGEDIEEGCSCVCRKVGQRKRAYGYAQGDIGRRERGVRQGSYGAKACVQEEMDKRRS